VDGRSAARRGERHTVLRFFGVAHVIGQVRHRQPRIDHEHVGNLGDQADRLEILGRVVAQLGIERSIDGVADGVDVEGVAVCRRARHDLGTHVGIGTWPVFHHHGLSQLLAEPGSNQARNHVGGAACREAHDELDRFLRPGRRPLRRRQARQQGGARHGCQRGAAHERDAARGRRLLFHGCLLGVDDDRRKPSKTSRQ
jgi:hypothetical protein